MERKLASIKEITSIKPIIDADRIEVATIDGWNIVISKEDGFKVGDKVVYIEIDSQLPKNSCFEFMEKRKYRVRTISLRKQVSQGLIMPLSILPSKYKKSPIDTDVTNVLGITKYDPEQEKEDKEFEHKKHGFVYKYLMRFHFFRKIIKRKKSKKFNGKGFPKWIVKTDETRVQNLISLFDEHCKLKTLFSATEKIDGCSCTMAIKFDNKNKHKYFLCSRNRLLNVKEERSGMAHYYSIYDNIKAEKVLYEIAMSTNAKEVVLQGEIIGNNIQGNKYKIDGYDFYAFNLIIDGILYKTNEMTNVLKHYDIKSVPILNDIILPETIDELVNMSIGKSKVRKEQKREGIVLRNNEKNISFKVINPKFLLDEKDD